MLATFALHRHLLLRDRVVHKLGSEGPNSTDLVAGIDSLTIAEASVPEEAPVATLTLLKI